MYTRSRCGRWIKIDVRRLIDACGIINQSVSRHADGRVIGQSVISQSSAGRDVVVVVV